MFAVFGMLEFFANCQQENTNDNNANEQISFPGKLFFQENAGKHQGNHTNRGEDGGSNGIYSTEGIHIGKLASGFKYSGKNLVLMLRNGAELDLLCFQKDFEHGSKRRAYRRRYSCRK